MTPAEDIDGGQPRCLWARDSRTTGFLKQRQSVGGRVVDSNHSDLRLKNIRRGYQDGAHSSSPMDHDAQPLAPRNAALRIVKVYSCRRSWNPRKSGTWTRQRASQGQGKTHQSAGRYGKAVTRLSAPATSYPTFPASQFPTSAAGIDFGPTSDYRFPYPMAIHPRERPDARPSPFPHCRPGQHPALIRPPLSVTRPPSLGARADTRLQGTRGSVACASPLVTGARATEPPRRPSGAGCGIF